MSNAPRLRALVLVAVLGASYAALLPVANVAAQAVADPDVPVPFASVPGLDAVTLHFWRADVPASGSPEPCNDADAAEQAPITGSVCSLRVNPVPGPNPATPDIETMVVLQDDAPPEVPEVSLARFILETNPGTVTTEGAVFPFTIPRGDDAIQFTFFYDSEAVCDPFLTGQGQELEFHVQVRAAPGTDLGGPTPFGEEVVSVCNVPAGGLSDNEAHEVSGGIDLMQEEEVEAGEFLVVDIFAVNPQVPNLRWTLLFEDASYDSRIEVRTNQAVEQAIWATDATGRHVQTFDPNAAAADRFLVGRLALRSAFGAAAVPTTGFDGQILDPAGALVALNNDADDPISEVRFLHILSLQASDGARKIYKFDEIELESGADEQPWHYPAGVESGSYTIKVTGSLLGEARTLVRRIAMGAFDFTIALVEGEVPNHQLLRGSSSTYLMALTNGASVRDTYRLTAAFEFSSRNLVWTVAIAGVDQQNRISLDPGDVGLLQVKLTPPSNAQSGDAARAKVTVESLGSTATKFVNIEAQVTTITVRDVGLLLLQSEPFEVGIDRENPVTAYVWNRGTAADSFTASIVPGSATPSDATKFSASLSQTRFDNVDPGAVAPIPIKVTTTTSVSGGDTFEFKVRAQSVGEADETAEVTIRTVVEAVRDFAFFALNLLDNQAQTSVRYGKWSFTDADQAVEGAPEAFPTPPAFYCERNPAVSEEDAAECGNFTRWAYHRFTLKNIGDQSETYQLSRVGFRFGDSGGNCGPILGGEGGRLSDEETVLIGAIDHDAPGTEPAITSLQLDPGQTKRFYFRVSYDGETPYFGTAPDFMDGGGCFWESYTTGIRVELQGVRTANIDTLTRIYNAFPSDPDTAAAFRGSVSFDDRSLEGALLRGLPSHVPLTPAVEKTVPFTLSLQSGHEDQVRVTVGPRNVVNALLDAGWGIELVSLDVAADEGTLEGLQLIVPSRTLMGPAPANLAIGHAAGADYTMGLRVTAPATGIQENERHTLSVEAVSLFEAAARDTLGIPLQIGEDFDFELVPGTDTIEAHAGDMVAFGLTVKNTGASRDRYTVTATAPGTFQPPLVTPSVLEISPTSEKATSVQVTVPDAAAAGSSATIAVTATSLGDPLDEDDEIVKETTYKVEVRPEGTLSMVADPAVVTVGPGGRASINYTIENQAAEDRTVRLTEVFAPPGWVTTLSSVPAGDIRELPAGGSVPFTYLVEAPDDIVQGSRYVFVVRVEDADDGADFDNGVAAAVVAGTAAVSLEPEDTKIVVDRGGAAIFNVLVRNTGASLAWFKLQTQFQSAGWSARVLDQDGDLVENATVRVPEKTFKRVQIEVTAPATVDKGHVETVTLSAAAEGQPSVADQLQLEAAVHDFDIGLLVEGAATRDAAPGDDALFLVTVQNRGNGPDKVKLTFEDTTGGAPVYRVRTGLTQDTTPELEAGETLTGIRVEVLVPSPNQGPVPTPGGVVTVIRATANAGLAGPGAPTVTAPITTRIVPYVRYDVDGDGVFELALDRNRTPQDGFEEYADRDEEMIERGEMARADSEASRGLFVVDGDGDARQEHIVDTDGDGIGDVYFDPDKAQTSKIEYTVDADKDAEPETPIDSDFDGLIDGVYDPESDTVHDAVNLDFSGDGKRDLLIDTDDDGAYDTFVDPDATPDVVTDVDKDGDRYKIDTDDDGKVDTYYNVKTQSIQEATSSNLKDFFVNYWYFIVLFLVVVALFVVIVVRRL